MALNNLGLGFVFTARDLASGTMGRVSSTFKQTATSAQKSAAVTNAAFAGIGIGVAALTTGLVGLAVGVKAANQFGSFGKAIAGIGAITKATDEEVRQLEESAIQAGLKTQFSPDEAAEGLQNLATAGLNAQQSMSALIPTLDLATGSLGQLTVGEAGAAVVGTLNAFGKSADEATAVTDKLLRITQLTNFQTGDFAAGLSKAAAAGGQFNQTLDDTLVVMGLLRNRNIDASSSSTAVREALRRIGADKNAQSALKEVGVSAFDAAGDMKPMIETMFELKDATADMTQEERNAIVVRAFGARGLLAFNAVTTESVEKVAELRKELASASGTAEGFKNKLLETFEGQKQILGGVMQTFGVVLGKGFAAVFKPFVAAFAQGMSFITTLLAKMPDSVKTAIAGLAVFSSVGLTLIGVLTLIGAALALLAPIAGTIGTTIAAGVAAIWPLILVFGAATTAVLVFAKAVQDNLGGLGDFAAGAFKTVRLAFEGIVQLLREGKISGAVAEELAKAENKGILNFVSRVFVLVERVKAFFAGIGEGFQAGLTAAGPAVENFLVALRLLGKALGFVGSEVDQVANAQAFDDMAAAGARVGKMVADGFAFAIRQITIVILLVHEAITFFRQFGAILSPLQRAIGSLGQAFTKAGMSIGLAFGAVGEGMSTWDMLVVAMKIGIAIIVGALTGLINLFSMVVSVVGGVVASVVGYFSGLYNAIVGVVKLIWGVLTGDWKMAWEGAAQIVFGVVSAVVNLIGGMLEGVAGALDQFSQAATGKTLGIQDAITDTREDLLTGLRKELGLKLGEATVTATQEKTISEGITRARAVQPVPVARAVRTGNTTLDERPPLAEAFGTRAAPEPITAEQTAAALTAGAARAKPPVVNNHVRVEVDGAEVAAVVSGDDGRGFAPGSPPQG